MLAQTPEQTTPSDLENAAKDFVNLLAQGQFEQAVQKLEPGLVKADTVTQFEQAVKGLIEQQGAFQEISGTTLLHEANLDLVYVTTKFANGSVDIQIAFNQDGKVVGMHYYPAGMGAAAAQPYKTAAYADPQTFTAQEVTVGDTRSPLPGTLTMPNGSGPFPGVVLVHGSGPNDRDETIYTNKPFRDLAEGLSSQGIAVLRYDKRTKVYPEQFVGETGRFTVKEETVDDALAAIDLLRHTPGIDPKQIYLLGHSLGGLLAPRIAAQAPDLAGVIILAGPTRPLEDLMIEQVTYLSQLDGSISADEQAQIDELKAQAAKVRDAALAADASQVNLLGAPGAYWLDLRSYDPVGTADGLSMPLFFLRGERDYQVTQADFDGWKAALENKPGVTFKQYPDLNHLFIRGAGAPNPQEYQVTSHVSELVVNDIASFINTGQVNPKIPLIGGKLTFQEITRLVLLILPILLIQIGVSIFTLVDLAKRKNTHGPRWLWAVLLVITLFTLPTGLIVSAVYLIWGRKEDDEDDREDDDTD